MPEPAEPKPAEYYMGITPDTMGDCQKLVALIGGDTLSLLVEGMEKVVSEGNGELTVACKQGEAVFVKYAISKSTKRRGHF